MHSRFILACAFAVLMPTCGLAADCTMEQLSISPYSVIDPCTRRLERPGLTNNEKSLTHFVRGRGYHRTMRLDEAHRDYRAAFDLDPKNAEILVSWSNVDLRRDDGRAYAARVEQAYELDPNNPHVLRAVGAMFHNFGGREKALEFYDKALGIDPAEPFALYFRSSIYSDQRKFKEAIADADALVVIPRKTLDEYGFIDVDGTVRDFHVAALLSRAEILAAAGQRDLAGRDHDAAVAIERSLRTLIARAWFLFDVKERRPQALSDLQEAVRLEPGDGYAQHSLGLLLFDADRLDEAFNAFDAAVKLQPDDGASLRMRARMHRRFGRTEEAVADLEAAVSRDPRELNTTISSLRHSGYWTSRQTPQALTAELRDAIRACMLDTMCN
jgi:tetratricopeptide (TPR) repeat protein